MGAINTRGKQGLLRKIIHQLSNESGSQWKLSHDRRFLLLSEVS